MEVLRKSNIPACMEKTRTLHINAEELDKKGDALSMEFLLLKSLPNRAKLCITCKPSAIEHCKIGKKELNDVISNLK